MRANSFILIALLTLAGFGAGMLVGGRLGSFKAATVAAAPPSPADHLPAINPHRKCGASGRTGAAPEPASIAEIEAAIQKAVRMISGRGYKALNELMLKVNPSDIPQLLAFVEKLPSVNNKSQLRSLLLARWAETDVSSAMAYADAVTGS